MANKTLKVALVQRRVSNNLATNIDANIDAIKQAAANGAELVLLQELHNSHYFCQTENTNNFDLAETIPGPSTDKLAACAQENKVVIVASLFEKRATGLYHNTAVVLDRKSVV